MSALLLRDRVKETTTTTGTGTLTLAGAATGYQAFSVAGDGARCRFCTEDGTNWEVAEGIYTASGTTLTRATIIASSNGGAAVSWSAGSKNVFLVADASFMAGLPSISASTAAPTNPRDNDLWFKTDEGSLKIYYNDGDSSQWIDLMAGQPLTGGWTKIGRIVTSGSQTTVDFSNLPQTYGSLKIVWTGRDTASGTSNSSLRLRLNNDATAANYTSSKRCLVDNTTVTGGSVAASTKGVYVGGMPNDGNTAGNAAAGDILLPHYANTTWHKNILVPIWSEDDGVPNTTLGTQAARYLSTSAINQATLLTDGTAFKDGCIFDLYGLA